MNKKVSRLSTVFHQTVKFERKFPWVIEFLMDTIKRSFFRSKLIKQFYHEITISATRTVLKKACVLILIYLYGSILIYNYSNNEISDLIGRLISLVLIMLCVNLTFFLNRHTAFVRFAHFVSLIIIVEEMFRHYNLSKPIEVLYSPILQIIIICFTCSPLQLISCMSISVLSISFLLIVTLVRLHPRNINNETYLEYTFSLKEFVKVNYVLGQLILWFSMLINVFYVYCCNRIWCHSALLTLGENVQAKHQTKQAMRGQVRWIEAVMPEVVKEEYLLSRGENRYNNLAFIKPFDNVSILFADIVGFTRMSSNKTASGVVTLLNDLFNRFDALCSLTNCEKLGTLGDCYYCVAGCPIPTQNHAVCCVEMGLGMCRIIKYFNVDHGEDVNMRVGLHTGRVNAAIIGKYRFRFDVYSNDVIIANALESSGIPGQLHISQSTYELVKHLYRAEEGDNLEIKREEDHGIGGMVLKTISLQTYFVDPSASHLTKVGEVFEKSPEFHVEIAGLNKDASSGFLFDEMSDNSFADKDKMNKTAFFEKIDKDSTFIAGMRFDPDKQIGYFMSPPINPIFLKYYNPEIEWHYHNHVIDHVQLTLYSSKICPLIESLVSAFCTILIVGAGVLFFPKDKYAIINLMYVCALIGLSVSFVLIELWKSSTYYGLLESKWEKYLYTFLYSYVYQSMHCIYMTVLPNTICHLLFYNCKQFTNNYYYQARYFSLSLFAMINGALSVYTSYPIKVIGLLLVYAQCIICQYFFICKKESLLTPLISPYKCMNCSNAIILDRMMSDYLLQITFTTIVLIVLVYEREKNQRIWFYVSREAEISREEALRQMLTSRDLLYNIIPKYVFEYIKLRCGEDSNIHSFNYAVAIPKAGVAFACISNFFSQYYREDYKGGSNALKLLNQIIMSFDDLLMKNKYKDVEKIKTINDCYMVASGLNIEEVERNISEDMHLKALMNYCFEIRRLLKTFNEKYIIGTDNFEIKIGYNYGPVTAGIIGSTKPMYDIWGDTVNVASRMYSTSKPGQLQVPHYVTGTLKKHFDFIYRGMIFVKGKGNMNTYLCIKERGIFFEH